MRHLTNNNQVIFNLLHLVDLNFYIFTRQSLVDKSSFLKSQYIDYYIIQIEHTVLDGRLI